MGVLSNLPKLKRGLGLAFSTHFLHENVPYLILYQLAKFQCYTHFSLQDVKKNVLLKVHLCRFENLPIYSNLYKNNTVKISHS